MLCYLQQRNQKTYSLRISQLLCVTASGPGRAMNAWDTIHLDAMLQIRRKQENEDLQVH